MKRSEDSDIVTYSVPIERLSLMHEGDTVLLGALPSGSIVLGLDMLRLDPTLTVLVPRGEPIEPAEGVTVTREGTS